MTYSDSIFTPFEAQVRESDLPQQFTYPYHYQPHLLCRLAAKQLQQHIEAQHFWHLQTRGNMFGVLVVKHGNGEIGYLSAFSGHLAGKHHLPRFVPPVFDIERAGNELHLMQQQQPVLLEQIEKMTSDSEIDKNILFNALKEEYNLISNAVSKYISSHCHLLNANGDSNNLLEIFQHTTFQKPPNHSHDCVMPKLLQYAFKQKMKPIAIAQFWWGKPPPFKLRRQGQFYPACSGRCKPILQHMLSGIDVEANPLLNSGVQDKTIEIIYQDDDLVVINKPAGLLSILGKDIQDSVLRRMQALYPDASGPLIVHRLDMSTSGLMVIALNKTSHQHLQQQFIERTVNKRYVALLEGVLKESSGCIDLPMTLDWLERPRQKVNYQYGKKAITEWQLVTRYADSTKVLFYPKTGRTHQLRVHAAHHQGLNCPIVGDDLYGNSSNRLHLHAEQLILVHPVTQKTMTFQCEANF